MSMDEKKRRVLIAEETFGGAAGAFSSLFESSFDPLKIGNFSFGSPTSWWKFNESSGDAVDEMGAHNLTNNNTTPFSTGKINNCAVLDGVEGAAGNWFSAADHADFEPATGDWGWMGWVWLDAVDQDQYVFGKLASGDSSNVLGLRTENTNSKFTLKKPDGSDSYSTSTPPIGKWLLVLANRASNTAALCFTAEDEADIDTTIETYWTSASSQGVNARVFGVGATQGPLYNLDGKIDASFWKKGAYFTFLDYAKIFNYGAGNETPPIVFNYQGTCYVDCDGTPAKSAIVLHNEAVDTTKPFLIKNRVMMNITAATIAEADYIFLLRLASSATKITYATAGTLGVKVWVQKAAGVETLHMKAKTGGSDKYYDPTTDTWQASNLAAYTGTVTGTWFIVEIEKFDSGKMVVRIKDDDEALLVESAEFLMATSADPFWAFFGDESTSATNYVDDIQCTSFQIFGETIKDTIKKANAWPYRRIYIKRRGTDSEYETDWYDITEYVKDWGSISASLDEVRLNKFTMGSVDITFDNTTKAFCDENTEGSLFCEHLTPYMTRCKIELGYYADQTKSRIIPETCDLFHGVLVNDIDLSQDEATVTFCSLIYILDNQSAEDLTLLATDPASTIIEKIRDLQVNGEYVFDRYIETWNIDTTTAVYTDITASGALAGMSCWNVIEKLAEAESMCAFIGCDGSFNFTSKRLGAYSLPDNLYLYYKFNGNLTDSSSQGNTGTIVDSGTGNSTYVSSPDAKVALALQLRGSAANYAYARTGAACKFMSNGTADNWTLDLWFKIKNYYPVGTTTATILSRGSSSSADPTADGDFKLYFSENGSKFDIIFKIWDAATSAVLTYTFTGDDTERISEDEFANFFITYDGDTLKCYKNNVEIYTNTINKTFSDAANTRYVYICVPIQKGIGSNDNRMIIDILRIFADVLTLTERTGLYYYGAGSEQGIFSADVSSPYYKFYGNAANFEFGTNVIEVSDYSKGWQEVYNYIQCEYGSGTYTTTEEGWTPRDGGSTDKYGQRIYSFQNFWMNVAQASVACQNIFNENYIPLERITIKAPIVPGLGLADLVYYDTGDMGGVQASNYGQIIKIDVDMNEMTAEYKIKQLG